VLFQQVGTGSSALWSRPELAQPQIDPHKLRIVAESYSASSTPGSEPGYFEYTGSISAHRSDHGTALSICARKAARLVVFPYRSNPASVWVFNVQPAWPAGLGFFFIAARANLPSKHSRGYCIIEAINRQAVRVHGNRENSKEIAMLVDVEINSRRVVRHVFLLHRVSNVQMSRDRFSVIEADRLQQLFESVGER
jgi:hypothetical protein